jgi:hypothetical protein
VKRSGDKNQCNKKNAPKNEICRYKTQIEASNIFSLSFGGTKTILPGVCMKVR